jgi:hypothetical protein
MALIPLNVNTGAGGLGTASDINNLMPYKSVQFYDFTGKAAAQLQVSNDNVHWVDYGDSVTTDGMVVMNISCALMRVHLTSRTSGSQTVTLHGLHQAW